jgi:hypothetical protein
LNLVESDSTGLNLVLSTQDDDANKNWPGKWAIIEEKVKDDLTQQWYYSDKDGSLHNGAFP